MQFLITIVVLSLFCLQAEEAGLTEMGKAIIAESGLGHLSEMDQLLAIKLFTAGIEQGARLEQQQSTAKKAALKYLEEIGYESVFIKIRNVDGRDILIKKGDFGSYATSEVPFGLNRISCPDGFYPTKSGIGGGLTELIGPDGVSYDFILARWTRLEK